MFDMRASWAQECWQVAAKFTYTYTHVLVCMLLRDA